MNCLTFAKQNDNIVKLFSLFILSFDKHPFISCCRYVLGLRADSKMSKPFAWQNIDPSDLEL